jgi:tetratricopeptide (TPR) repeat protein
MRPKNQYVFITAEAERRRGSLYSLRLTPTRRGDFFLNWGTYFGSVTKAVLITGILFCIASGLSAQSAKEYIKYGDDAMAKGEYYNAAQYFKQGMDAYQYNIELEYKYAEALRGFNDYENASEAYKKVIKDDVARAYPLASFWYGIMLHYLGKYEPAIVQFKKFKSRYTEKGYYKDKAQQEIESCSWAHDNAKDNDTLNIIHLPEGVNTPYSETNPFEGRNGHLLFSSLRDQSANKNKPKFLARIYESDSAYQSSKIFPVPAPDQSKHIANGAWSPDMKSFYFTVCDPVGANQSLLRCDIYVSYVAGDSLSGAKKLGDSINMAGTTSTQPNVAINEKGEEVLYFVSDRPGGYGKTDIWMSRVHKGGGYDKPVNLGPKINSKDEEFSPFYDSREHKLYFSSDWYYGFGGLDIYQSQYKDSAWSSPKNMGLGINSTENDFYFYMGPDRSKNYFASNRKGSFYIKSETCCNDIWMYATGMKIAVPKRIDTAQTKIIARVKKDTAAIPIRPKIASVVKKDTTPIPGAGITSHIDTPQAPLIDESIINSKQRVSVTLYFHNDEPECCNLRDTTSLEYVETYKLYMRFRYKYQDEYDRDLTGDQKKEADKEVSSLFTDKVEKGYNELLRFTAQMQNILQSGRKMEITIQGYCSPLNYSQYNIKLGYRRIASLRNYFYHYHDGVLMPYIQRGDLVLRNQSLGKEKAAKSVSDNGDDIRNSVYSPAAALERKVEIIFVEIK